MTALQGWVATSVLFTFVNANFYGDRFPVYWNLFSETCNRRNKSLIPLDDYGITHNQDHKFHGEQIVLLYEYNFDDYPFLQKSNDTEKGYRIHSGGIPQRCNLSLFFTNAEKYIKKEVPDPNFHGLGILDFEEWRPLLYLNWGKKTIYITESEEYVRERFPDLSEKAVRARAAYEFDKAAEKLFVGLLLLAKKLRPFAKWGYYLYPYCNLGGIRKGFTDCTNWSQYNDQLRFIYEHQTALYPSVYYGKHDSPYNYRLAQIQLREARRISFSLKNPVPIYVYTKFEYNPYDGNRTTFYVKDDLCNSIQSAVDEGASGLILWSTSNKITERCTMIGDFVQKTLGTVVQNAIRKANKCSLKKCSGRGICVVRGDLYDKCKWSMKGKDYYCECDPGFAGEHCEKRRRRGSRRKNRLRGSSYVKTLNLPFNVDLSGEDSTAAVPLPTDEEPFA